MACKRQTGKPGNAGRGFSVVHVPDICAIRVFGGGTVEVIRQGSGTAGGGGTRSRIKYLSSRARTKMLFTLATTNREFKSLLTLTYPRFYPSNGLVVKGDLNRFRVSFNRRFGGSVFWFIEFQSRGAPHFHLLSERGNPTNKDRQDMALLWVRAQRLSAGTVASDIFTKEQVDLWGSAIKVHEHKKAWEKLRKPGAALRYATKYALKTTQKVVPEAFGDIGRFWGCSNDVRQDAKPSVEYAISESALRDILAHEGHPTRDWEYLPKYVFGLDAAI